jgi:GT2 family glycosyltransferase
VTGVIRVRHIDLAVGFADGEPSDRDAMTVYWWDALPLGAELSAAEELPQSPATLRAFAARLLAEQRSARDVALGAPLVAGYGGEARAPLSLSSVLEVEPGLAWLADKALPSELAADDLSVIVCTRDRGEALATCLTALEAQRRPPGEIIVVDNSADANAAGVCAARPTVRYVHEPRPGLSFARNAGIAAAAGQLVAFTDDDVTPQANWTAEIVRAFAGSSAEAITGLVLPVRLDTEPQRTFELVTGSFGARFHPLLFDSRFFAETVGDGAQVWRIGAGANMAFRRSVFDRIGGFDTRLGAGASGCSEDSEFWYRILATGGSCFYEPRAVVLHDHRADWPGLKRQMRAYMNGHVSALIAQADMFNHPGNLRRIFLQLPRYFITQGVKSLNGAPARRRVLQQQFLGWASGLRYLFNLGWRRRRPSRPSILEDNRS